MTDKILINIKNAQFFKNIELGKMDPYCIIKIGSQKYRTKTHNKGGKTPNWNETTTMIIDNQNSGIITVWDKDTFSSDDLLGECKFDLEQIKKLGTYNAAYELFKKGVCRGTVFIDFEMINQKKKEQNNFPPGYQPNMPNYNMPPSGYNQPNMPNYNMPPSGYNQPNMPNYNMPPSGYNQPNYPPNMPPPGFNQPNYPPNMPPPGYNQPNMPPQGFNQPNYPPNMPPPGYNQYPPY